MGGRGASGARRGGGMGAIGGVTITPGAGGSVTITPNAQQNANAQNIPNGGSGISDVNTHTTYFTPADRALLGNDNTDGYRISPRTGRPVPVGWYQTGDYANIQQELRDVANGNRKTLSRQTQKVVDALDRNMKPLNGDIVTTRWLTVDAIADNIGMPGASKSQIIKALNGKSVTRTKNDYTASSWNIKDNAVAGVAGRTVKLQMHYRKGAMAQFSPTGMEAELVGARGKPQRYENAHAGRVWAANARTGGRYVDALILDCYVDS